MEIGNLFFSFFAGFLLCFVVFPHEKQERVVQVLIEL